MVWSLSKDDDGLDSVHPLEPDARKVAVVGGRGSSATPAPGSVRPVPTVVVDPISQMPQAAAAEARRRAIEPTLVLKGRKLDEMRAQVAAQKSAHRRRKQVTLLTWAFAGGIALSLGWIAGLTLKVGPAAKEAVVSEEVTSPPRAKTADVDERSSAPAEELRTRTTEKESLHLEDLPADNDDAAVEAESARQEPTESDKSAADKPDSEAFTLDDLPFD